MPAAVLIASFVGTGSSFLAFASIAARRGMQAADYPNKGIYYLGGLTEGSETIAHILGIGVKNIRLIYVNPYADDGIWGHA